MGKGMKAGKKPSKGNKANKMGNMGGMQAQLKQMQAMQRKMEEVQGEIEQKEVTTTAGGGAVEVTVSGAKEVKSIKLKPEIVDPDDIEMLEDLILVAVNEGMRQMEEISEQEMAKVTGGLNIPGLM